MTLCNSADTSNSCTKQTNQACQDLGFLTRFQSHYPGSSASTESLQIIFGGFPSVF
jgi:hypothetical protein